MPQNTSLIVAFQFLQLVAGAALAQGVTLPEGASVAAGHVTMSRPDGSTLQIGQAGQAAIINWNSFSIGSGAAVHFANGAGATLNRVTGAGRSAIDGLLTGTGSVYLINPEGVVIGPNGVVRTGGDFLASTLNIRDPDFLDRGGAVFSGPSTAVVANLGRVSSLGGNVSLLARHVVNAGHISAPKGTAALVAGREILMRDSALGIGRFEVRLGSADSSVEARGTIRAATAELRANGGNVYALAGNTRGTIRATGVEKRGGRVFLTAGKAGHVKVAKTVRATRTGGAGGRITVSGGSADIEGRLDASAIHGDGGQVSVVARGATDLSGFILAMGAGPGAAPGRAEVSGGRLSLTGRVDTGGGTFVIDPTNVEIDYYGGHLTGTGPTTVIDPTTLATQLDTQNVTVVTGSGGTDAGTILVNSSVNYSSAYTLSLVAQGDVVFHAPVLNDGAGAINVLAGWDGTTGAGAIGSNGFPVATFDGLDLAGQTAFGNANGIGYSINNMITYASPLASPPANSPADPNASGSVIIGSADGYGAHVGSKDGPTRIYGNNVTLLGSSTSYAPAQIGYFTRGDLATPAGGPISVRAVGNISLHGGTGVLSYAQIGHIGPAAGFPEAPASSASANAPITLEAGGNLTLSAGSVSGAYAQLGHGAKVSDPDSMVDGAMTGAITATIGGQVTTNVATAAAWIGNVAKAPAPGTASPLDLTAAGFTSGGAGDFANAMLGADLEIGNVTLNATAGGFTLQGSALTGASDFDNDLVVTASGDIRLPAGFAYSTGGAGRVALSTGGAFVNNAGAGAFTMGSGRWLVFSGRPDNDTGGIGTLPAGFVEYGRAFSAAAPFAPGLPAGNGLVYPVTPLITLDDVTETFGDTTTPPGYTISVGGSPVSATAFGLGVTPALDGSVVTASDRSPDGFVNAGSYPGAFTALSSGVYAPSPGPTVYGASQTGGNLTVNPATVTVTPAPQTVAGPGIPYSGTLTYSGWKGTDGPGLITAGPTILYDGDTAVPTAPGTYTITPAGLAESSGNYTLAPQPAEFTVSKPDVPPTTTPPPTVGPTPGAVPTGPRAVPPRARPGLSVINPHNTGVIVNLIREATKTCAELPQKEYTVDCLSERLKLVSDALPPDGDYAQVRAALSTASDKLHALAVENASRSLTRSLGPVPTGAEISRPLTPVAKDALKITNSKAMAIIKGTQLVLLRSAEHSERKRLPYQRIARAMDSNKLLLRSS